MTPNPPRRPLTRNRWLWAVLLPLLSANALHARTIVLTDIDCEQVAAISSEAPRIGWAGHGEAGRWSNFYVDIYPTRAFLIRFPVEKVPKGFRITNAEWVLPTVYVYPEGEKRLEVHRLLSEWGPGVCHEYRMTRPNKVKWATPGARGASRDRAAKATAVIRLNAAKELAVNVTEDVELWYTGTAPNHGWILTLEQENGLVRFNAPSFNARGTWKLRITYEPE